jgi:hypothetical protein
MLDFGLWTIKASCCLATSAFTIKIAPINGDIFMAEREGWFDRLTITQFDCQPSTMSEYSNPALVERWWRGRDLTHK